MMAKQRRFEPVFRELMDQNATGLDRSLVDALANIEGQLQRGEISRGDAEAAVGTVRARYTQARREAITDMREELSEGVSRYLEKRDRAPGADVRLRRLDLKFQGMGDDEIQALAKRYRDGVASLDSDEIQRLSAGLKTSDPELFADVRGTAKERGDLSPWRQDESLREISDEIEEQQSIADGYVRVRGKEGYVDSRIENLADLDGELDQPA